MCCSPPYVDDCGVDRAGQHGHHTPGASAPPSQTKPLPLGLVMCGLEITPPPLTLTLTLTRYYCARAYLMASVCGECVRIFDK